MRVVPRGDADEIDGRIGKDFVRVRAGLFETEFSLRVERRKPMCGCDPTKHRTRVLLEQRQQHTPGKRARPDEPDAHGPRDRPHGARNGRRLRSFRRHGGRAV